MDFFFTASEEEGIYNKSSARTQRGGETVSSVSSYHTGFELLFNIEKILLLLLLLLLIIIIISHEVICTVKKSM